MNLLEKTKEMAQRLVDLLEDPHPGLLTWQMAVCDVLSDLAEVAPGTYCRPGKGRRQPPQHDQEKTR